MHIEMPPNSEIYYTTLIRDKARLISYKDESIRTKVERPGQMK